MNGKQIRCLQIVLENVPIHLQQFTSYSNHKCKNYSNHKCKKSAFSRTTAHIFVSSGDAPATITQCVTWMERQFNACETPRSMYLSILNTFRVIRCLSKCVSPKIAIFTFLFPLGTPQGEIMQYVAWMESKFDAYKLYCRMYPFTFNSLPVIRTTSAKNRRYHVPQPTFLFPLETPLRL